MTRGQNTPDEMPPGSEGSPRRFEGMSAIVTGGGSGIGAATAMRLAREGASVVVVDLSTEDARATVKEVAAIGAQAQVEVGDVTDPETWQRLIRSTERTFGGIDVLVNNACSWVVQPAHVLSLSSWHRQIDACLSSVFLGFQACHDSLSARQGAVVNVSSVHATFGVAGHPAYAAAKGGVVSLTRQLAVDYGPRIRVNAVLPGPILTAAWDTVTEQERARSVESTVAKRFGAPEEVAAAVAFLASSDASFITGASLVVDGGWSAWK